MSESQSHSNEFAKLAAEQKIVQVGKFQGRLADEYGEYIFMIEQTDKTTEVAEFLKARFGDKTENLEDILKGLIKEKNGKNISWVDMAGGRGLAMRQVKLRPELSEKVEMTNVDLNNYGLSGLGTADIAYFEKKAPGVTNNSLEPKFVLANSETVKLSKPAELITSIEAMQYLDHPIAAICNWYNQLEDNGLLIISTEHDWSNWIRYVGSAYSDDPHPMGKVLEMFKANNIKFADTYDSYHKSGRRIRRMTPGFRDFVVQKKPSTLLFPTSAVKQIYYNPVNYKAVYYEKDVTPIEIVKNNASTVSIQKRYSDQVSAIDRQGFRVD